MTQLQKEHRDALEIMNMHHAEDIFGIKINIASVS